MPRFPEDQFDQLPEGLERVGAHRGPAPRGRGWIRFAWGALLTGVLVVGGLFALTRVVPGFELDFPVFAEATPTITPTPTPTAEPITDPSTVKKKKLPSISVFNASGINNANTKVANTIQDAGWGKPATANTDGLQDHTTIYYQNAELEGFARGLAILTGATEIRLSDAYLGADITVLVGSDFAG